MPANDTVMVLANPMSLASDVVNANGLSFTLRNGVAIPQDSKTLGVFQGLQRISNRFLLVRERLTRKFRPEQATPLLKVDGRIGPQTLQTVVDIMANIGAQPQTVTDTARLAQFYAIQIGQDIGETPDFKPSTVPPVDMPPPTEECDVECQQRRLKRRRNIQMAAGLGLGLTAAGLLWFANRGGEF